MTTQSTPTHLALRPNNVNRPASDVLENFCLRIGERLRQEEQPAILSVTRMAAWWRSAFQLEPPIMPKLGELFDTLGIDWTSEDVGSDTPAAYLYDHNRRQWRIFVNADAGNMDSIHSLHELCELFYWRCYHLIPEWKEWARASKIKHPHAIADQFARDLVLNLSSYGYVAKQYYYNPIQLNAIYQTPAGICFQALISTQFHIPYIQMRFNTEEQENQSCFALFDDDMGTRAKLHSKAAKFRANHKRQRWAAMFLLNEQLPKIGSFVTMDEWICQAIQGKFADCREVDTLFGIRLPQTVFVVIRPGLGKPFLQILPASHKSMLIDPALRGRLEGMQPVND